MKKVLIVKLGALGDVVRSTVLLSELSKRFDEIHWLTSKSALDLLNSSKIFKKYIYENEENKNSLINQDFDLIINLEEDKQILEFVSLVKTKKLIGHFLNLSLPLGVDYTPECNYWLDMSFISKKYSREEADLIKLQSKISVPEIWYDMVFGENVWNGQEYDLGVSPKPLNEIKGKIGLIDVTESKWPNKYWQGYTELKKMLQDDGFIVESLGFRPTLKEHVDDINNCEIIVCGDTSGMHIALALKKRVVAIFNCTPPDEIYDYGRMKKIVSPLLEKYFLKRIDDYGAQSVISVEEVYNVVKELLKS